MPETGWFPVRDVARFAVTGADRVRYLNGQVSNDVRRLRPGEAMQACVLSARGKLDAVVWMWPEDDRIVVECDAGQAEALAMRLERYIVADDVTLTPIEVPPTFHVFGAAAADRPGLRIPRLREAGADVAEPPTDVPEIAAEQRELLRIVRAVPVWGAELTADTLPAEAGLDETAVDFHKGCYIGQEVVSRIRSVGHANRVLRVFDVGSGAAPVRGAKFFAEPAPTAEGETAARAAAEVTSIHLSAAVGLCYMRRGTSEGALLTSPDGSTTIQLRPPASIHA